MQFKGVLGYMVNGWRGLELEVLRDKGTPLVAISALFAYRVALFVCLESFENFTRY